MSGIVGYAGSKDALPVVIGSLKRLEYRGYDSAGIAYQNGKGIEIFRTRGKIADLQDALPSPLPEARVGLGHTRWATHGIPSERNSHPHRSAGVAVVHNGIIANYRKLKSELMSEGITFSSDTDTEVIPHMISRNLGLGLPLKKAISETVSRLRGTFALVILSETHPHTLFALRRDRPLVLGIGTDEYFIASDVCAILPHAREFVFLEDGQICTLTVNGFEIEHLETQGPAPVKRQSVTVDWAPAAAEREGYDHFMLKEIHDQPRTVADTFDEWIKNPQSLLDESGLSPNMTLGLRRLQMVACGSSYHAALIGRFLIERFARVSVDVDIASEYRYRDPIVDNGTLLLSISQSGETADTLAAQRAAKKRKIKTLTLSNVVGSTSSLEADAVLYTRAGPEIGVASTKTFTAQLTVLTLFALALGIRRGTLSLKEANTVKSRLMEIPEAIRAALQKDAEIRELAATLLQSRGFLCLGRGINYPIALEGALKLKEISYVHAEAYPAGEMKHGPIALVENGLPIIVLAPRDDLFEKMALSMEEAKARGGRVVGITDTVEALPGSVHDAIAMPSTHHLLWPFVSVIPLQLLAYHIAVLRGCPVDQPRHLAKSITDE
ncbi:MAG: glutamine--fructose-6-phosphate transaminase (isomerizing) [Nitrospirae bacterium]|nr:glutamine--fructose-6-phosphate transaminase (isomerizing) [Nitrospirota bacterium]